MCTKNQLDMMLKQIADYSKELFGDKFKNIILYGSYARGAFCHYGMMRRMLWYYLLFIKRQNHLSNKFTFILVLRRAFNINMTAFS